MYRLSFLTDNFPIVLARSITRDDLKWLSPLVIGGWDVLKSQRVAAWLDSLGDSKEPWSLILKTREEFSPYLECYHSLQNWTVLVNKEPVLDTAPRIYVFEDIRCRVDSPANLPRSQEEILALAAVWPVIVVPSPDGSLPDYLQPIAGMTSDLLLPDKPLKLIGWARSNLSPNQSTTSRRIEILKNNYQEVREKKNGLY